MLLDRRHPSVGVHNVTLRLTDSTGTPLGSSDSGCPIRSAEVSRVIWVILGAGVVLLFGAIAVRLVRRVRRRRATSRAGQPHERRQDRPASDGMTARPRKVLASSAVMATGTVVSRMSGYVRTLLLAAAIGNELHADLFNIGNTIPNMLYILLAGGVFNAVLVPQLVRAQKNDADGGEAYTNRIITLALLFLGAVTVLLVIAAPLVMRLYLNRSYDDPALAAQRDSAIAFARYCLPQVFFYGMFVLLGQVLNARGRFGPMMWAPIANNVIAIAGPGRLPGLVRPAARRPSGCAAFTRPRSCVLGLGATLGIVVAGRWSCCPTCGPPASRFRPRYDFRDTGLGHTLRLGVWTVLFVVVNQVAYTVVVRLASGGTAAAAAASAAGRRTPPATPSTPRPSCS